MKEIMKIRAHHIDALGYNYLIGLKNLKLRYASYGKEFAEFVDNLNKILLTNPKQKIKIVRRLDIICKHNCKLENKDCLKNNLDIITEKGYNLIPGNIYTAEKLINKIIQFHKKENPYLTPREKQRSLLVD